MTIAPLARRGVSHPAHTSSGRSLPVGAWFGALHLICATAAACPARSLPPAPLVPLEQLAWLHVKHIAEGLEKLGLK